MKERPYHNTYGENENFNAWKKDHSKMVGSKFDADLFDESKAIPAPVIRIKRTNTTSKGERWKIMLNDELIFVIEGAKLSKREREYLRSVAGVSFITQQVRCNITTFSKLRAELKRFLATQDELQRTKQTADVSKSHRR